MCFYLDALKNMVTGSVFKEIVLESVVVASDSLTQALSGNHYNRAM